MLQDLVDYTARVGWILIEWKVSRGASYCLIVYRKKSETSSESFIVRCLLVLGYLDENISFKCEKYLYIWKYFLSLFVNSGYKDIGYGNMFIRECWEGSSISAQYKSVEWNLSPCLWVISYNRVLLMSGHVFCTTADRESCFVSQSAFQDSSLWAERQGQGPWWRFIWSQCRTLAANMMTKWTFVCLTVHYSQPHLTMKFRIVNFHYLSV